MNWNEQIQFFSEQIQFSKWINPSFQNENSNFFQIRHIFNFSASPTDKRGKMSKVWFYVQNNFFILNLLLFYPQLWFSFLSLYLRLLGLGEDKYEFLLRMNQNFNLMPPTIPLVFFFKDPAVSWNLTRIFS